ncbi:unnamed protein product [Peronospora destructor]|uniref:Uncharacterized protein n=1 Tax=Peronospora destructor TaxID=86335 RepID=A0AAV0THV4_9STRA|nr:unnamed protein product [Peronospora destructor]
MTSITIMSARIQGDPVSRSWVCDFSSSAEAISVNKHSVKCEHKNKMQSVGFYEMVIVQPTNSIKHYKNHMPPEYGVFVAMDGAKCTNAGIGLPESCKVDDGLDGSTEVGPNVGCNQQSSDLHPPYPDNYWFSFPNLCAQRYHDEKTPESRTEFHGVFVPWEYNLMEILARTLTRFWAT